MGAELNGLRPVCEEIFDPLNRLRGDLKVIYFGDKGVWVYGVE